MHPCLVTLIHIVSHQQLLALELLSDLSLLFILDTLCLLSQDAGIVSIEKRQQTAPVIPKIVRNRLIVLL